MLTEFSDINSSHQKQIDTVLPEEAVQVAKRHVEESKQYCDELLAETIVVEKQVAALRKKIQETHAAGADKSYLKSSLASYEKCVPAINVDGMKKQLDSDIKVVEGIEERAKESVAIVKANYSKFMAEQEKQL